MITAPEYDLREIGPDDWEIFREVRLRSLADAPDAFGSGYDDWAAAPEARWRARMQAVPYTVIARRGSEVVGVVCGTLDGDDAVELISMWVAPETRGTGVAGALISAVVGWATAQGRSTYLMVLDSNARAIAAYGKAGFVDQGVPAGWPAGQPLERRMEHRPDRG